MTTCMIAMSQDGGGRCVRLVPWTIALRISGTTITPPTTFRWLPDHVPKGNARLIDAETGAHLWTDCFDRAKADLLEMQNEITAGIASTLRVQLVGFESRRGQRERPNNPDATDLAMQGWGLIDASQTRDNNAAARRLFEEALKVDPQAVSALTGLGFTHIRDVINRRTDAYGDHLHRADELIEHAIAMIPNNAQAHQYKALLRRAQRRSQEALAAAERAVSLNRNVSGAYTAIG
jgi:tetratricopeptide (TPR) repeat protein